MRFLTSTLFFLPVPVAFGVLVTVTEIIDRGDRVKNELVHREWHAQLMCFTVRLPIP